MAQRSRSERKSTRSPRNRMGIFGSGRNERESYDEFPFPDENYEDENEDPDHLLRRAIDQKRGTFKKPPRPVYDSWNLPEEASSKPSPTRSGKGPKNYKRSDERIREDVCEALIAHPEIDASDMEVEVKEGVVFLTGSVESRLVKRMAEDLVETISGVTDIRNELYFMNHYGVKANGNGKRNYKTREPR